MSRLLRLEPPPLGEGQMTRRGHTGNHGGDRMGDPIIRGNALVPVHTPTRGLSSNRAILEGL
jgi:hypothetical protein